MPYRCFLLPALLLFVIVLSACDRDRAAARDDAAAADTTALPKPEAGRGSITGMPDEPGPGAIGPPPEAVDTEFASDQLPTFDVAPEEPGSQEAIAVVRDYYAAIGARDYARAHALWSGTGEASGQTLEQFAAGFADTTELVAEAGEPGRIEPAAGSRYIEVPVSIRATRSDGSVHRYLGKYVLRRAVVDGASDEQRAWRITSADLREVL